MFEVENWQNPDQITINTVKDRSQRLLRLDTLCSRIGIEMSTAETRMDDKERKPFLSSHLTQKLKAVIFDQACGYVNHFHDVHHYAHLQLSRGLH